MEKSFIKPICGEVSYSGQHPFCDDCLNELFHELPSEFWRKHPADIFDEMTAKGYKLNLVTGEYYRQ